MRNVVLVTFDSLRADHCGFMGYERNTTPTLDQIAAESLSFRTAIAPGPSTPESMPVIMTGEFPMNTADDEGSLLASRRAKIGRHMQARGTLAERFSRAGYDTAAFSPNPYTSRYFGFDEGFDHFEDFLGGSRERLYQGMLDGALSGTSLGSVLPFRILINWLQREEVFKPWEAFYDDVRDWIRQASEPYFVWILLMDTHDPYLVPTEYRTQSRRAMYHANYRLWRQGHEPPFSQATHDRLVRAYDDTINYSDAFVSRLRTDLAGDDPLIAVHSDHGEAFGEHGTYGHHQQLYEENVHVPLVIDAWDDERITQPFGLQSIPDLLISLALNDTLPSWDSTAIPSRTLNEEWLAVRGHRWKHLRNGAGTELYDLSIGEQESDEVEAEELRAVAQALSTAYTEHANERKRVASAVTETISQRL